ncbi:MAG: ATP-dependent DNA helicase RecG [Candidatus Izemoplasmatales bacterium]|jgi:ATP-dependent DNA helicase RecG|nr:ATP-dependent DNA helicase RecG [Candidatus Izemoplasmatales bacterium]
MDLQNISGVGKVTLNKLNELNIMSIEDMLFTFPRKYEINYLNNIEEKELEKTLILKIEVTSKPKVFYIRKKLTKLTFSAKIENFKFQVSIFNREFLSHSINPGEYIVATGKFLKNFNSFSASNIVLFSNFQEGIKPLYNIKEITDYRIRKIIENIIKQDYKIIDNLPHFIKRKRNFESIDEIIKKIHLPEKISDVQKAKERMAYEEFLYFAVRVETIKKLNQRIITPKKNYDITKVKSLIQTLPFELTHDQKSATNDIFKDFNKDTRMNRLLQGDVGSGKTIVSLISAYAIVTSNYQVAILAPTLVLAQQHFQTFKRYLNGIDVKIELLTSEISQLEKKRIAKALSENKVDIIIGTHSLLQENINFSRLGFVIIDEQQRFGVEQRKVIREKGVNPDILMMTATPIPRTLAISMFENTDVSTIKEKPSDRKNIKTEIIDNDSLEKAFKVIDKEIQNNHQIYVICPLIEKSETRNQISVEEAFKIIRKRFKTAKIDMLHGKMSDDEKINTLTNFYNNSTNILISTTVVEVGVNVNNATAMLIFNANMFGLSQIHQLRGRVGRNDFSAYCFLMVDNILEESERLEILEETNDGFLISEHDLKLRGPGEVFGSLQSGIPSFKFANIITDENLREMAFEDATEVLKSKDEISKKLVFKVIKSIDSYNLD